MTQNSPDSRSLNTKIANGTGWVIAWRVATRNLGLISTLILVRLLDPADFGLVALATGFAATVDALSVLGVQDALLRAQSPSRDMYDSAFSIALLRGVGTALLIAAAAWPVADFFKEPRLAVVLLSLAAGTVITALENIGTVDFRRDMTFKKEFHLQVAGRVAGVITTIALAWLWRDYWALVVGLLTTRVVRLVQSYIMSPYRPRLTLRAWRSLIGFSLWSWAITMVQQVRSRADNFVIGRLMTTADVASFSVGQEIGALPITEMVEPLHRTLFSAFVVLNHNEKDPHTLYLNVLEAAFLLVLPAGVGISLIADPMVHLMLGERWLSAIPVVQILAIVSTISMFGTLSDAMNAAAGNLRVNFIMYSISAALRVPLLLVLVSAYGVTGGAVALGLSTLADQVLFVDVTLRRLDIHAKELVTRLWRAILACLAMTACLWSVGWAWTSTTGDSIFTVSVDMLLRAGAGALTYTAAIVILWIAAGRPNGAERYVFDQIQKLIGRLTGAAAAR